MSRQSYILIDISTCISPQCPKQLHLLQSSPSTFDMTAPATPGDEARVTLVGCGTIGLAFAAFHLQHLKSPSQLTILDTRPDLEDHVRSTLPKYLEPSKEALASEVRLISDVREAVADADIIQEQGPENVEFKSKLWAEVEQHAKHSALFWSSTSGIPASAQSKDMKDKSRLIVVHPYNPPHIMPLLEVVPSPQTSDEVIEQTLSWWRARERTPVLIKKEVTGFVSNRLAFALLREAIQLVNEDVVTPEEIDDVVTSSMGPRWAVAGPFKSYHAGGGSGGLEAFFKNIGGTVQGCWAASDAGKTNVGEGWEENIFARTKEAYGIVDTAQRDRKTKAVLDAARNS
jgi:3-hydroxyacyl-CoA dehydrogenase